MSVTYRRHGQSGLRVSPLCLGAMMFGGQTDETVSERIIGAAREQGINFIDTAHAYNGGRSEEVVGRAIAADRHHWVVATKVAAPFGTGPNHPPQGHPVVVQAGSSEAGQELAAATAEVVFTAQPTLQEAQGFYASLKGRVARHGRDPDSVAIMPGILPVIGRTAAEAEDRYAQIQQLIHPDVGLRLLSQLLGGVDLTGHAPDGPLPDVPETNATKSRLALVRALAGREALTLRETWLAVAGGRGHWTVIGTADQIADEMEARFRGGGADGFNVKPPLLPSGFDDFVSQVVPELRRRGLFRYNYEGATLRDHLGLARPPNRFAEAAPIAVGRRA